MKLEKENAMKKFKKMLAAILATVTVATTLSTATLVSGNTESDKFNIFRDAGEISDEFMAETSEITRKNWQDNYFSSIVMTLGQREMYVDGTKVDLSFAPALDDDNKLVIPAPELAEQVGAEVTIDEKTGKIGLETENGAFNIDSDAAVSGKVSEAGNVSEIGNAAQASGAAQTRGDTSVTDLLDKISEEKSPCATTSRLWPKRPTEASPSATLSFMKRKLSGTSGWMLICRATALLFQIPISSGKSFFMLKTAEIFQTIGAQRNLQPTAGDFISCSMRPRRRPGLLMKPSAETAVSSM